MFKLSALNETNEDIAHVGRPAKDTKEAQEAQAFKLYNEALRLQQNDCRDEAVSVYEQLLETPLIMESATTLVNEHNEAIEHPLKDPGLILKYSAHKNVASICASQGNINKAMENYLQAVMLDTSDVTLWHKIGIIAAKLSNLHLSRRAFTQGLECNPNHWPCLDSLITVCYAILDYENCLGWISKALLKDSLFKKGIYLRRKMISECPHLRRDFDHLFQDCGTEVFELEISEQDAKLVLDEALTLREKNRKLCIPPDIPDIPLKLPLKSLTWLNLGKSLIATYEFIETQEEPISITNRIEMKVFDEKRDEGTKDIAEPKTQPTLSHPSSAMVEKTVDEGSILEQTAIAVVCGTSQASIANNSSVIITCSNADVPETQTLQDSDSLPPSSGDLNSQILTPNSQKKIAKDKKLTENKISKQRRRSKRHSSIMKQRSLSKITEHEPCQPQEPDFRQTLLLLLPETLQVGQSQTTQLDLDSDTNSQDSSGFYNLPADTESLNSSQCSESNATASTTAFVASADIVIDITVADAKPGDKMKDEETDAALPKGHVASTDIVMDITVTDAKPDKMKDEETDAALPKGHVTSTDIAMVITVADAALPTGHVASADIVVDITVADAKPDDKMKDEETDAALPKGHAASTDIVMDVTAADAKPDKMKDEETDAVLPKGHVASTDIAMDITVADAALPKGHVQSTDVIMDITVADAKPDDKMKDEETDAALTEGQVSEFVTPIDLRSCDDNNNLNYKLSIPKINIICPSAPTSAEDVSKTAYMALDANEEIEVDSKSISKSEAPIRGLPSSSALTLVCSTSNATTAGSEGFIDQVTHAQSSLDTSKCENVDSIKAVKNTSRTNAPERDVVLDEEATEVLKFIETYNHKNGGIMQLLQLYCKYLGRRSHLKWENGLKDVFVRAFGITQPSLKLEAFTEDNLHNKDKIMFAFYILTHLECVLDEKYKRHSVDFDYFPSKLEYAGMGYIIDASFHPEIFEEDPMPEYRFKNFILRFHWVRANYFFLSGDKNSAFCELTVCSKLCFKETEIPLQHLKHYNTIELSLIKRRLALLRRFQILEHVESLFAEENYLEIIKQLTPELDEDVNTTSQETATSNSDDGRETRERPKLLKYLIKSSVALSDMEITMKNLSFVMLEATVSISYLENSKFEKETKPKHFTKLVHKWNSLLRFCCEILSKSLDSNIENLATLDKEAMVKVTSSLLSLINSNHLHIPTKTQFLVKSELGKSFLRPLVLLFRITKFEEERRPQSLPDADDFTGSVKILLAAHDFLADKGLCCIDDGALLRLLLKNLLSQIEETKYRDRNERNFGQSMENVDAEDSTCSVGLKKDLQSKIEQCFFCLYGYPSKAGKSRGLVDHSSQQTALKWEDAVVLYGYFRPEILPGFDSYKINTMLSEMAGLLTRIIKLIPEKIASNLKVAREILDEFLSANDANKELIIPAICGEDDLKVFGDVYYLLADYYFKHKEMTQAAKYYLSDLCINPERFDSWAGLALVRSTIIEDKLRLCVTKSSAKGPGVLKLSKVAISCFEKAVDIDQGSTTLWIEFGSLAYWMQSYFSRQKRLEAKISDEETSALLKQKSEMLDLAEKCFNSALTCDPEDVNNEEWLLQYMLGKVLEKRQESPHKYLPKYARSASLLHRKHAKYPKKIQFKSYQSNYAIEALELYFRLHASILKLVQHEINVLEDFDDGEKRSALTCEDYDLFDDLIEEAQEGNFVKRESLPYSQLYDKPVEGPIKKQSIRGKLNVPGSERQSCLSMGSLLPDSIVSALSFQLSTEEDSTEIDANFPAKAAASNGLHTDKEMSVADTQPTHPARCMNAGAKPSTVSPSHPPEQYSDVQMKSNSPRLQMKFLTEDQRRSRALKVVKLCVSALHLCLGRLPQHYKSLYRLADLYWRCKSNRRHVTWSCDLLLSSETPWQQLPHMPCQGLLNERNKTNLFNGVWKIPVDEIDRPGSFGCHLYRCILLLLDALLEEKDQNRLLYLHNILSRNPDQGRKYLQDHDRIQASKIALSYSIKALQGKLTTSSPAKATETVAVPVSQPGYPKEKDSKQLIMSETLAHLMDAGKIYQRRQRAGNLDDSPGNSELHKDLLLAAFQKYISTCPGAITLSPDFEFLPSFTKVEKILKFCLQCTMISKGTTGSAQGPNMSPVAATKTDSKMVTGIKKSPFEAEKKQDKISSSPFLGKATSLLLESVKRSAAGTLPEEVAKKRKLSPVSGVSTGQNSGVTSAMYQTPERVLSSILKPSSGSNISCSTLTEREERPIDLSSPKLKATTSLIEKQTPMFVQRSKPMPTQQQFVVTSTSAGSSIAIPISKSRETAINLCSVASGRYPLLYSTNVVDVSKNTSTTTTIETISIEANCSNIAEHEKGENLLKDSGIFPENRLIKVSEDSNIIATDISKSQTKAEIKTVVQGSQVYTKIVPTKPVAFKFFPSLGSAFTPTKIPRTLKQNRQLEKLKAQNKAPLLRSASLPESSSCPGHRTLQRTSSISDYTKQKLKSSILMRTSASFVRKPSITEQEIQQLLVGDAESSQSEDEDEFEATFKPLVAASEDTAMTSGSVSKTIDIPIAITPVSTPCASRAGSCTNSPDIT